MLFEYEEIEGEIKEKAVRDRCVIGSLARVMRGKNKRFMEQHSSANIVVLIRDLDME